MICLDKSFLSKTIKALEDNTNATLCCTKVNFIDFEGNKIDEMSYLSKISSFDNSNKNIFEKYEHFTNNLNNLCIIYGLYRYSAIKKVLPFPIIIG